MNILKLKKWKRTQIKKKLEIKKLTNFIKILPLKETKAIPCLKNIYLTLILHSDLPSYFYFIYNKRILCKQQKHKQDTKLITLMSV